jgi:uncharacterized protein (TIGR02058 family)
MGCIESYAQTRVPWAKSADGASGKLQAVVVAGDPLQCLLNVNDAGVTRMPKKRMVLEIGMGTDIRGTDPTKAACRALRDALWHNTLSIATALGQPLDAMIVDVHIGVPHPEKVNKAEVLAVLPYGRGTVTVVEGGLEIRNDDGTDSTLIANACAVVSLDIP